MAMSGKWSYFLVRKKGRDVRKKLCNAHCVSQFLSNMMARKVVQMWCPFFGHISGCAALLVKQIAFTSIIGDVLMQWSLLYE